MVKKIFVLAIVLITFFSSISSFAQGYNQEQKVLTNFLVRMYNNAPFDGVRVVTDYDNSYLLVVVGLNPEKYSNSTILNRVASVKAMSEASRYFNGSVLTSDLIIRTCETVNSTYETEIIEHINECSIGYVKKWNCYTVLMKLMIEGYSFF